MSSSGTNLRRREKVGRGSHALPGGLLQPRHAIVVGPHHRANIVRERQGEIPIRCEAGAETPANPKLAIGRGLNSSAAQFRHDAESPVNAMKEGSNVRLESLTDFKTWSGIVNAAEDPKADALKVLTGARVQSESAIAVSLGPMAGGEVATRNQRAAEGASKDRPPANDETSAAILMRLANDARIFRGLDDRFYAEVPADAHDEIHELGSPAFEGWLIRSLRRERKALPTLDGLKRLVRALEADAMALGSTEEVWVRVAGGCRKTRTRREPAQPSANGIAAEYGAGAVYYVDLGDSSREAVEIRAEGCRIVTRPPVSFWRPRGMHPLPRPCWDGSIELLKKYVNVADGDFPLLVAWMTAALRPAGPYPLLLLSGEQGLAKSTMARVLRRLIDPSSAELRALPGSQRDLMIEARNTWVLAYDNVSEISAPISDALCRIATGGGISTRTLFSDSDNTLLDVQRPALITGIDDFVRRSDLIDRCIFLHLPAIPEEKRRLEHELWDAFEADYPRLLGSLLGAVSAGLRAAPTVRLPALPRMADFAHWGEAVSRGLGWEAGLFLSQYKANRREACISALDDCPVADAVRRLLDYAEPTWHGTASELHSLLTRFTPPHTRSSGRWPKSPLSLGMVLRRIAPQLGMIGISVKFDRGRNTRLITLSEGPLHER